MAIDETVDSARIAVQGWMYGQPDYESNSAMSPQAKLGSNGRPGWYDEMVQQWPRLASLVGQGRAVHIRDVGAQDESGALTAALRLEQAGLALGELDGVGTRRDERVDRSGKVLDALEERLLTEEPVIDRDVEAATGLGVEQATETEGDVGHEFLSRGMGMPAPIACARH